MFVLLVSPGVPGSLFVLFFLYHVVFPIVLFLILPGMLCLDVLKIVLPSFLALDFLLSHPLIPFIVIVLTCFSEYPLVRSFFPKLSTTSEVVLMSWRSSVWASLLSKSFERI